MTKECDPELERGRSWAETECVNPDAATKKPIMNALVITCETID
jgi:hypothetical protein